MTGKTLAAAPAAVCFIDTETTSLRHDRRAWEIGIIARTAAGDDTEHTFLVDAADLMSLRIGQFHQRHPQMSIGERHMPYSAIVDAEADVLWQVEAITRGAHLVGNVVSFDADVLGQRMRAHGITPSWHYHLCDIEVMAAGYLAGCGAVLPLPWDSEAISRALGVDPERFGRHTALGDARWAAATWDAMKHEGGHAAGG